MIGPDMIDWARENMAAVEFESCGPSGHVCPEDRPGEIGEAIRAWADRHRLG